MIVLVQAAVVAIFCSYVFFDLSSLTPRIAGSITKNNGLGYTCHVQINTLKRIFVVSYPPLLGFISVISDFGTLVTTIFIAYFASIIPLAISVLFRERIISFFCALVQAYDEKPGMLRASFKAIKHRNEWLSEAQSYISASFEGWLPLNKAINIKLMLIATWVYLFYASSMFTINIVGDRFDQYSQIIYQLVGLFNALGTMVFSFVLDPRLSRIYERQESLGVTHNSLLGAHFLNLMILGPTLVAIISTIIWW